MNVVENFARVILADNKQIGFVNNFFILHYFAH